MKNEGVELSSAESPTATIDVTGTTLTVGQRFLRYLRKPNPPQLFVPQMDGLRFIALLAVFFLHFHQSISFKLTPDDEGAFTALIQRLCSVGFFGVQIFFTISGFVLALPFARLHLAGGKPIILGKYLSRRLWRLEPPLLINLILLTPTIVLLTGEFTWPEAFHRFVKTIFYFHYLSSGELSPINRVTWSLETEAQFYLAMPLLGLLFKIPGAAFRRSIFLAVAVICIWFKYSVNKASLPAQFEFFAIGIVLADLYLTDWSRKLGSSKMWDVVGITSWTMMLTTLVLFQSNGFPRSFMLAFWVFFATAATLRGKTLHRLFAGKTITLIGGMCYSFYLYHDPILRYGAAFLRPFMPDNYEARFAIEIMILAPAVALATVATYALFERPFMNRSKSRN